MPGPDTRTSQSNFDLVDYINGLRESILEAYTGIIGGLKTGGKADLLLPHVNSVLAFLHMALTDQDRTETILRSSIGLIGDLAEAFPNGQLKEPLSASWVAEMLKAGRTKLGGSETKKVAKWAKEVYQKGARVRLLKRMLTLRIGYVADGPSRNFVDSMESTGRAVLPFPPDLRPLLPASPFPFLLHFHKVPRFRSFILLGSAPPAPHAFSRT